MQSNEFFLMRFHLQIFAEGAAAGDGGEGGSASATGAIPGDAGQVTNAAKKSLEELGVPKERAERYRARKAKTQDGTEHHDNGGEIAAAAPQKEEPRAGENRAPAEAAKEGQDAAARSIRWEDAIADPEINRKLQETITARTKNLREAMKDLAPALDVIGKLYGMDLSDPGKADLKAFAKAVTEDDRFFEDKALEMGVDVKTAKRMENLEADKRRREAEDAKRQEDAAWDRHIAKVKAEAETLKKQFPSFRMDVEMQNPAFRRMTSPEGGLSVKQAYFAVHGDEIAAAREAETARQVSAALSKSMRAGQQMPQENGAGSKAAAGVAAKPYSQMNAQERAAYRRLLESGRLRY